MATAARALPLPAPPAPRPLDRRSLAVLSAGHCCADTCQGALPAIIPFLVADRGYSFGQVSLLVLAATISSSVVQPLFGIASDRKAMAAIMPAGLVLAGAGIAVVGLLDAFALIFLAVVISGLGVAAYHPEGSRYAAYASGDRPGAGMSIFSVGGNAGLALGAIIVTPALLLFGLPGTAVLALPAAAAAAVLVAGLPRLNALRPADGRRPAPRGGHARDRPAAFARLGLAVTVRSFVYFGLLTFVPLYFIDELGTSETTGNIALAVMLASGAAGTLIGGPLADRIGARTVFVGSMALLAPLIGLFLIAGVAGAIASLALVGAVTISTFSVSVVLAQELLPSRLGLASGVVLGLSIGLGGIGAVGVGALADAHGVSEALHWLLILPPIACALAFSLPRTAAERAGRRGRRGARMEIP